MVLKEATDKPEVQAATYDGIKTKSTADVVQIKNVCAAIAVIVVPNSTRKPFLSAIL